MSSLFLDISAALDKNLNDMAGKPDGIAWPNAEFTPTDGSLWVRPTVIMADTAGGTLGASVQGMYSGFYQVDVFAPAGEGKGEAYAMADLIADQFKRGTQLAYNGRTIECMQSTYLAARNDGAWFVIPLQIDFYSLTTERT